MRQKRLFLAVTVCTFALLAFPAVGLDTASSKTDSPAHYAWSETSDYVRVPKTFLGQIYIEAATITNFETMEFVLASDFIKVFKVTPPEVARITMGITAALHERRSLQSRHLISTDEKVNLGQWESAVVERFAFRLEPFDAESSQIRHKLEGQVRATLGYERAEYLLDYSVMLYSESDGLGRDMPADSGITRRTIYTFMLRNAKSGLEIDLNDTTITTGGGHSGSSAGARPFPKCFDPYAPDSMKPILARWRHLVAETSLKAAPAIPPNAVIAGESIHAHSKLSQTESEPGVSPLSSPPLDSLNAQGKWEPAIPWVDLPKRLIPSFQIPGFTADDDISPDAITLFGLDNREQDDVRALYAVMKGRFEQLERAHLDRPDPLECVFVIRAFPEEAKALQKQWLHQLSGVLGTNRADLLDRCARIQLRPFLPRRGVFREHNDIRALTKGPTWLHRGMRETQITFTLGKDPAGQPVIEHIQWQIEGGERGGGGGAGQKIPERWRHLLTLDMLESAPLL